MKKILSDIIKRNTDEKCIVSENKMYFIFDFINDKFLIRKEKIEQMKTNKRELERFIKDELCL
jgi:hypothetical protein